MRTFVLFALTLAGLAALADDASAGIFGRKNRGRGGNDCCQTQVATSSCCGSGYGGGYGGYGAPAYGPGYGHGYGHHGAMPSGTPCCGQTAGYGQMQGGAYGASYGGTPCCGSSAFVGQPGGQWMGGQGGLGGGGVIQTTDGKTYVRGADGTYYSHEGGAQFSGGMYGSPVYGGYPGMHGGVYRNGIYQAGYPGSYYGPGVIPTGGIPPLNMPGAPIPQPMPNK